MDELEEKIARALVAADEQNGGPPWDYVVGLGKHAIAARMDQARACLSAIEESGMVIVPRELTDEMYDAGDHAADTVPAIWAACIDAAPKPPTPSATGK